MNQEVLIDVKNICKSFRVYMDRSNTLKERILFSNRRKYENRHVLKGLSFQVRKGEAVGLIGHNGCGKSTTLKLLTKIMYPDSGSIQLKGRVVSLIELGAGFHPDMSGRENIYINASIFGLTKKEIDSRLAQIIGFSELEEFIDNPVRTYSSGMYARLAFSVAINVNADILLIDEILAVGDIAFQTKCFQRLRELKQQGVAIVIVSHSLIQIEAMCDSTIWLHDGLIKRQGPSKQVHKEYVDYMKKVNKNPGSDVEETVEQGNRVFELYPLNGFHEEEYQVGRFICWMKDLEATFHLRNSEGQFQEKMEIHYVHGLPPEHYTKEMKLKVKIDNHSLLETVVDYSGKIEIEIPVEYRKHSLDMTFEVSYLWKPDEFLFNGDERMLGIALVLTATD